MRLTITLLSSVLALSACSKDPTVSDGGVIEATNVITAVATSELNPPSRVIKASVSPKEFTNWLGHILLLTEDGQILSSNTGFGSISQIADSGFKDVQGLARGDKPSIVLGLTNDGKLKAFIDDNNEKFKPLPVVENVGDLASFCSAELPATDYVYARNFSGEVLKLNIKLPASGALSVTKSDVVGKGSMACALNKSEQLYMLNEKSKLAVLSGNDNFGGFSQTMNGMSPIETDAGTAFLITRSGQDGAFVVQGDQLLRLKIEAGLSIYGIENPSWIWATSASMGNTFNKGLILVGDKDSNRIVMISNEYLLGQLEEISAQ